MILTVSELLVVSIVVFLVSTFTYFITGTTILDSNRFTESNFFKSLLVAHSYLMLCLCAVSAYWITNCIRELI